LVQANHDVLLYPNWINTSDYKNTADTFGTVALRNTELAAAVNVLDLGDEVKLTSDMKYLCKVMGTVLPFLPIIGELEMALFGKLFLKGFTNENSMALEWTKHLDGVKIFPKLPVHLRNYRQRFDRNRRVKNAFKQAKAKRDLLSELNEKLLPSQANPNDEAPNEDSSVTEEISIENPSVAADNIVARTPVPSPQPAPYLTTWAPIMQQQPMNAPSDFARTGLSQVQVGFTAIDLCPEVTVQPSLIRKKKSGERGHDKGTRKKRRCGHCKGKVSDPEARACDGSSKKEYCKRFDVHGNLIN